MFKNKKYLILIIVVLAALLRLVKLGSIPVQFTPDEASLGYNAYSVLKTGRDEYGSFLPVIFKSFGDFKPGLYVYLTIPSVAVFGLNEFSVRLPSAVLGIVSVFLVYLIVNKFTKNDKLAICAGLSLAMSPWHIHLSRGAWEANVSLSLVLFGIWFFLCSLEKIKLLSLSAIFFALTFLAYQGAKLSTSIVIVCLLMVYWREIFKLFARQNYKIIAFSVFVAVAISLPIIASLFQGKTGRLAVFSVFSYPMETEYFKTLLSGGGEKMGDLSQELFHSQTYHYLGEIVDRWFNHFSGRFLFFEGDWQNLRHSVPNMGVMFWPDVVLLLLGIYVLFQKIDKFSKFTLLWLVLSPLPGALTRDQVQAVRSFNMVVPITFIAATGLYFIFSKINLSAGKRKRLAVCLGLLSIYVVSYVYFLDAYLIHLQKHDVKFEYYSYKQAVDEVTKLQSSHKRVVFQQTYAQPYIYFLFYNKYNPMDYQKQADLLESKIGDVGLVERLDNIEFIAFSWPVGGVSKGDIVAGDTIVIPEFYEKDKFNLLSEIKYPDGIAAFRILEAK